LGRTEVLASVLLGCDCSGLCAFPSVICVVRLVLYVMLSTGIYLLHSCALWSVCIGCLKLRCFGLEPVKRSSSCNQSLRCSFHQRSFWRVPFAGQNESSAHGSSATIEFPRSISPPARYGLRS